MKGNKVQGRRKEHLSVLGEITTAQYESACFLDAARPQIKKYGSRATTKRKKRNRFDCASSAAGRAALRDVHVYGQASEI